MWRQSSLVFALLLIAAAHSAAQGRPDFVARGDSAFRALHYDEAISAYHEALAAQDDSASVLWRLARVLICKGDVEEGKRSEALYREAERYARRAVELDSASSMTHTWYAAALGSVALHVGGKTKVRLTHHILHEVQRAIELNPNNDIAYSILGSFYRALAGLSWLERQLATIFLGRIPDGTYDDAERALTKAVELNPHAPRHRYELGLVYWDRGNVERAREQFARVVTMGIATARDTLNRTDALRRLRELSEE